MTTTEILEIPVAVLGGFWVAVYGFRHVSSWLFYSWSQLKPAHGRFGIAAFLVAFFLAPGPWVLVALAVSSSYFASSWWAPWALGGVAAGAVYVLGLAIIVMRNSRKASDERAT